MRIRTIKPEFWAHPVMSRQSDCTRLLAIGLLNHADDHGYFYADPALVRSALRSFDEDSTKIRASLGELCAIGYIEMREHPSHGPIGFIVSFSQHQRVDRPKDSIIKGLFDSTNDRRMIDDKSSLYGKGREWNGINTEGQSDGLATLPGVCVDFEPKKNPRFTPPSPDEVTAYASQIGHPMDGAAWCDAYAAKGWMIGKNKMKDWKCAVRNWKANNWHPVACKHDGFDKSAHIEII
jgi:hypothetical protein